MTTDVYGDILFLINAAMDCLCFLLTARLLRRHIHGGRLALASLLGGAYAVAALFVSVDRAIALVLDILTCILLCTLVFLPGKPSAGNRRWLSVFPISGVYLLVSFAMGGVMTGMYNLFNRAGCPEELADTGADGPTAWLFALLALLGGLLSLWGGRLFQRTGSQQNALLTVFLNGRSVTLSGLVDSGNLLTDPLDGKPVIPVKTDAIEALLSPSLVAAIRSGDISSKQVPETPRLRLIPTVTATDRGLILGIRPDRLVIRLPDSGCEREAVALIAPLDLPETRGADAPNAEALIPAVLM